jgi:Flp pilus assembly protein TadG
MNRLNNQRGQALVEFAFVAVVLLVMVLGVTEFGKAWYYDNALDNAVRTAVRKASETPYDGSYASTVSGYVTSEITASVPSMGGGVAVTVVPPSAANGKLVTVTASYAFDEPILSSLNSLASTFSFGAIPTSFTLQRTGTMYYELTIP